MRRPRVCRAALLCLATWGLLAIGQGATAGATARAPLPHDSGDLLAAVLVQLQDGSIEAGLARLEQAGQKGPLAREANLALARLGLQLGRYAAAQQAAKRLVRLGRDDREAQIWQARVQIAVGQYEPARRLLEDSMKRRPDDLAARVELGAVYPLLGEIHLSRALLERVPDLFQEGRIGSLSELLLLGRALHLLGYYRDAANIYQKAQRENEEDVELNLAWGDLLLEKYNYRDADLSYKKALTTDPLAVAAILGQARVDIESDGNRVKAFKRVEQVLQRCPQLIEALELQAELFLDAESYDEAEAALQKVLAINPRRLQSLSLLAATQELRDDKAAAQLTIERTLAINPRYAALYETIAQYAEQAHRYEDAIQLSEKALALDGEFAPALVRLGIGYSRLADDDKARLYLHRAHQIDPFNVRAYNMSEVLYGQVFDSFEFTTIGHFRYRLQKDERDILQTLVPPLVEQAYKNYVARYGFEPKAPLQVELFPSVEHFAIRSIGTRQLGAHGICFGHVLTARSPSAGNFNWAEVLWHEIAHIFHLQLSNSRVPRWFTEGLAVLEERQARPEWIRQMESDLAVATVRGQLASISQFNLAFTHARSRHQILLAYYQAYRVMEFIAQRWGFEKIVDMLKGYGAGRSTSELLATVLHTTGPDFDRDFAASLRQTLKVYFDNIEILLAGAPPDHDPKMSAAVRQGIINAQRLIAQGQKTAARQALERLVQQSPGQPHAHYLLGELAYDAKETLEARQHFEAVVNAGRDGYQLRMRLAALSLQEQDDRQAAQQLEAATRRDPLRPQPFGMLADVFDRLGRDPERYRALRNVSELDQNNVKWIRDASALAKRLGKTEDLGYWARRGLEIAPFDAEFHLLQGQEAASAGHWREAASAYQQAAGLHPKDEVAAWLEAARCFVKANSRPEALQSFDQARQRDPDRPAVREMARELGL